MVEQEEVKQEEIADGQLLPAPARDVLFRMIVIEAVCVTVLLVGLLSVRFISPKTFEGIHGWYTEHFLTETTVDEVLGAGDASSEAETGDEAGTEEEPSAGGEEADAN